MKRNKPTPNFVECLLAEKRLNVESSAELANDVGCCMEEEKKGPTEPQSTSTEDSAIPSCWSAEQVKYFSNKYDWLVIKNKKLGCKICEEVRVLSSDLTKGQKGVHVSSGWIGGTIQASGVSKLVQQSSLRKKMFEHSQSKAHKISTELWSNGGPSAAASSTSGEVVVVSSKAEEKVDHEAVVTTINIFNAVYSLCKRNRPLSAIDDELELLAKSGVNIGNCLHTRYSATHIVQHISAEIKSAIFKKIIDEEAKISVVVDEASSIAKKNALIVYLQCALSCAINPLTIFLELLELQNGVSAESAFQEITQSLAQNGFDNEYLKRNFVAFCCDGANNVLGRKSGLSIRVKQQFPEVFLWFCLNHKLQLVVDDAIGDIGGINHLKIFMDKMFNILHQSHKEYSELREIAVDVEAELFQIGRVLGSRWAACSLKAVKALWHSYLALCEYFSKRKEFVGMAKRLQNVNFLKDLALILDILEEIGLLSEALVSRSTTLCATYKLILRTVRGLENLKEGFGNHESQIEEMKQLAWYKSIQFVENFQFDALPRQRLLQSVIERMKMRLCEPHYEEVLELFNILEPSSWPIEQVTCPWAEGEKRLNLLGRHLKYSINVNDFRDFVELSLKSVTELSQLQQPQNLPPAIQHAKKIMGTFSINSVETERGFGVMSDTVTKERCKLLVKHVSSLMTIKLLGKPLQLWDATPYVKSWLINHRSATDTRVRKRSALNQAKNDSPTLNDEAIWNLY